MATVWIVIVPFLQDMSHSTHTGYKTLENVQKPLVMKQLKKIWEKDDPNLPREKGYYNESNTLLLDDSPYKALLNPVSFSLVFCQVIRFPMKYLFYIFYGKIIYALLNSNLCHLTLRLGFTSKDMKV